MTIHAFARGRRTAFFLLPFAALALLAPASPASAAALVSSAADRELPSQARGLPRGGTLRIEGTSLEGFAGSGGMELERFEPVAHGARFVVQDGTGAHERRPELPVWLRGSVDGMPNSVAVVSVRSDGEMRGVVSGADGTWTLERRPGSASSLRSHRVDRDALTKTKSFSCETLENPLPRRSAPTGASPTASTAGVAGAAAAPPTASLPIVYTAQIAVELDYDYYLTFAPDADAAILYALDLMAFTGALGESELGMNVQVPFVQLWTTAADPYSGGDSRLGQVQARWNQPAATNCGGSDCTALARSTVILLSSAPTGGVAYVPGLCDSWHNPTNSYSYAYVGSIGGDFDVHAPAAVWDIVATSHELGHNFGSHHTHCYDPPVDECYGSEDGCYSGPTSLPSGCPGAGQGCGTIMSYCHLRTGGMGNISLTYGTGHPYGDAPTRVPATMISQIGSEALAAPGCLSATDGMIELTVENAGSGKGSVTSAPAAIDCGAACRTWMDAGSAVTLTATPGAFSTFDGWSGDADCSDGAVTLDAATSCTATFTGTCGPSNEDCDDGDPCTADSCVSDDHCVHSAAPIGSCFVANKSALKIGNASPDDGDKLSWQWKGGDAFAQADLGNPTTTTGYRVCIFDSTAGSTRLATSLQIAAGGTSWRNYDPRGWLWSDKTAGSDGIKKLQLKPGAAGKGKIKLTGVGALLPIPAPFSASELFDEDSSVVVQLIAGDRCWTSSFSASGTSMNTPLGFKASGN